MTTYYVVEYSSNGGAVWHDFGWYGTLEQAQKASEQCSKVYNGYDVRLSKVTKEVLCNLPKQDD